MGQRFQSKVMDKAAGLRVWRFAGICCLLLALWAAVPASAAETATAEAEAPAQEASLEAKLAPFQSNPEVQRFTKSREALASDPYRPLYHFSTPEKLMNDPNGLCQWRGNYHLFYQLYPADASDVHWGHAVSTDLVHWKDMPIALYPTTEKDCFSGQALVEEDRVIAMYHGTGSGNSIATSSHPLLAEWEKHPDNPVIPNVETDADGNPYRIFDPCIWKGEDGYYYSLSGTYKDGARGHDARLAEHLFRSKDLADWDYLGLLIEGGFWTEPGEDGAVPNFLPIGNNKHMLLFFSHKSAAQYYVGDYDEAQHTFTPDYHGRMNYGPWVMGSLHAPSATVDDQGRFISIFNMRENRVPVSEALSGDSPDAWYGIMSLPRHLWLASDNSLRIAPVPELESLRFNHKQVGKRTIPANDELVLDGIEGKAMEIEAVIQPGEAREVGLHVLRSPDGEEQTTITLYMDMYEQGRRQLGIDVSNGSLRADAGSRSPEIGPLELPDGEPVHLNVYIDRSIVEVFANDRQCLTLRVYPAREDSRGVALFARGNDAELVSLDAWHMRSIWPALKKHEGK